MGRSRAYKNKKLKLKLPNGRWGLLLFALLMAACSHGPSNEFSITVVHLPIDPPTQDADDLYTYSSAIVSITRVDQNESNKEGRSELISSPFENGKVELHGEIEDPFWAEVRVETDDSEDPLITRTFIEQGESVSLAVIENNRAWIPDAIAYVGALSNVQHANKKFSLFADLNSLNVDLYQAIGTIEMASWSKKGERIWETISYIVLQDGKFSVEMEFEDPVTISVYIEGTHYHVSSRMVAEANTTVFVEPSRQTAYASANLTEGWFQVRQHNTPQNREQQQLAAIAGTGRHARLFESWQRSFTYRLKQEQLEDAIREERALLQQRETMKPLENTSELQSQESLQNLNDATMVKMAPSEDCGHVDLSEVRSSTRNQIDASVNSRLRKLWREMHSIRQRTLNDIARRATDPFDVLLALELGAFDTPQETPEAIKIYDELSVNIRETVAKERVTPARNYRLAVLESEQNEDRLVPGQKAPDFKLPNLQGNPQSLSQILKENEFVYLEFYRYSEFYSWSGRLAELHSVYGEQGLQIVEVLFDIGSEQQQELAANPDFEWVHLLDPHIYSMSDVAKSFAVVHRGSNYLIDAAGCIVQKNIDIGELYSFLDSHLDIPTSKQQLESVRDL